MAFIAITSLAIRKERCHPAVVSLLQLSGRSPVGFWRLVVCARINTLIDDKFGISIPPHYMIEPGCMRPVTAKAHDVGV
jgi:hypothetical protein